MTEESRLETEIRESMGKVIFEKAELPITVSDGKPIYTGKLNLKKYNECFPGSVNYKSIYLSLREINSELADGFAETLLRDEICKAVDEEKFEEAAQLKEQARKNVMEWFATHIYDTNIS